MSQHRDENDHCADKNLSSQKPERWRCRSFPAALFRTTKAVAAGIEIFQFFGHSPRFARVTGAVKAVAARAPSSPCLGGEIVIQS